MFPPKILLWFPACKWMGLEIDSFLGNSDMGLPLWSWKHLEDHTFCEEGSLWGAQKQTSLGELRTSPAALPALSPWWRVPSMEHSLEALLPPHAPPPLLGDHLLLQALPLSLLAHSLCCLSIPTAIVSFRLPSALSPFGPLLAYLQTLSLQGQKPGPFLFCTLCTSNSLSYGLRAP